MLRDTQIISSRARIGPQASWCQNVMLFPLYLPYRTEWGEKGKVSLSTVPFGCHSSYHHKRTKPGCGIWEAQLTVPAYCLQCVSPRAGRCLGRNHSPWEPGQRGRIRCNRHMRTRRFKRDESWGRGHTRRWSGRRISRVHHCSGLVDTSHSQTA